MFMNFLSISSKHESFLQISVGMTWLIHAHFNYLSHMSHEKPNGMANIGLKTLLSNSNVNAFTCCFMKVCSWKLEILKISIT